MRNGLFVCLMLLLPCGCSGASSALDRRASEAAAPGFCTRTLGSVECWQSPDPLDPPGTPIADGPAWAPAAPGSGEAREAP